MCHPATPDRAAGLAGRTTPGPAPAFRTRRTMQCAREPEWCSENYQDECAEQRIHAEPLSGRFEAAHGRCHVEAGRKPGCGDPEEPELHVPRARS